MTSGDSVTPRWKKHHRFVTGPWWQWSSFEAPFKGPSSQLVPLPPKFNGWNLKRSPWKRWFLLETIVFRFHVKFRGCRVLTLHFIGVITPVAPVIRTFKGIYSTGIPAHLVSRRLEGASDEGVLCRNLWPFPFPFGCIFRFHVNFCSIKYTWSCPPKNPDPTRSSRMDGRKIPSDYRENHFLRTHLDP